VAGSSSKRRRLNCESGRGDRSGRRRLSPVGCSVGRDMLGRLSPEPPEGEAAEGDDGRRGRRREDFGWRL